MQTTQNLPDGRGCGTRSEEAPYACCGFSKDGTPVELFVIDPAIPWPGKFQRGVKILPRNPKDPDSVNDLVVFIGKKFYESPWDFVEEVRRFGASRRLPNNLPFDQLTPGQSRMIFVHSNAIPQFEYEADRERPYHGCSCFWQICGSFDKNAWNEATPGHHHPEVKPCAHALRDLAFLVHGDIEPTHEGYQVNMSSFSYDAIFPTAPPAYQKPAWQTGIFMALPLSHIEYKNRADEQSKTNAEAAGFTTAVLDH